MAIHNELGKTGENIAHQYLLEKGYDIVSKNILLKKSEVDLIARFNGKLIFVEVKTRKSLDYSVQELISPSKQNALLRAAEYYKELHHLEEEIFFDLVCVILKNQNAYEIEHYQDMGYEL